MRWEEAPVYTRSYDLARYVVDRAQRFPKHQRFILGARLQEAAMDLVEHVACALRSRAHRGARLDAADDAATRLQIALRIAGDLGLLQQDQVRHACVELSTVGRMLGGWRRSELLSHAGEIP